MRSSVGLFRNCISAKAPFLRGVSVKLSVVIPVFNEARAITPVLSRLEAALTEWSREDENQHFEIILVDDGSTDESPTMLAQFESQFEKRVFRTSNNGYGAALNFGFQKCTGDFISFLDMDDTYDPTQLKMMCEHLGAKNWDMIVGDRLSKIEGMPLTRQIGNRLFVSVINSLFAKKVYDSCSGMRIFSSKYVSFFKDHLPQQLNFTLAMTLFFLKFEIPFGEIPIRYNERIGQSKLSIWIDGPRFLFTIIKFWLRYTLSAKQRNHIRTQILELS